MKRSVFISLLASLAMISCTNDTPDRYGNRVEKEFSFSAYQENQDTRSEVKDAGSIIMWSVDDKISVFTGGKNAEFVSGNTEPSTTASFTGTLSGSENDAYALYPYDPEATFSEGKITTSIPSEQVAKAGSFDPVAFVAVAKADKGNLMFKNVCGGVRFSVSKPGVKKVEISGNNNESLSGLVTISLDKDGTPSVVISNGFSTITVSSPSQDGFEPGVWYYATIVPVSLPDGFRMILRTENEYASYKHGFVEVKRSIFGSISNVDSGLSYISEQQAEDEMDDIHSLIVGNINDENCEDLLAALASQIEQNESVEKYSVSEDFASVTFKDGVTCDYPINNGSIFDEISKSSSQSGVRFKAQRTSGILDSEFNKEIVPNVVIFNIHHGDENRANQNALMERVYELFGGENNDKQVYSVGYFGYKEFTAENLYQATKKAKVIIISTLGTDKGESIAVYDPATYSGGYGFPLGYVIHKDKLNVEDPYTHKEILRNTVDVQKLLDDVPDESPLRFIYFASCNTLKKDIRIKKRGLTVAGWDGVNKAGEAFAYIMTDYAVNYGLSWKMFKTDFENSKGDIEDPIKSGTHLVFKGDASNDADIILNANDCYSWKREKNNADLSITEPENGARIRKGFFSGNYNVTVKINSSASIEKGHQETVNGIFYNLNIDDFSGKNYTDVPLVFNAGKATYSVKDLTPGVIKITVPASSTVKSHWLHMYSDDCVYALVSKDFEKNDGETFEDMPAPEVVTFDVKEDGNAHIVRCAVINQDASELTKGVKFWPKSNPSDFHEIESNEKKSGYTVKLPELVQGETYCVQGFADGEADGVRYYGDVLEFQNGSVQTAEPVDLGLPSGLKWASWNLGASVPEGYGDYFAWGETEPYYDTGYALENPQNHWKIGKSNGYAWSSYSWGAKLTKYNTNSKFGQNVDNKTVLDLDDDAAHVIWGGKWRIPTNEEWTELNNNCNTELTTINGVLGLKFTSLIPGYTDKWIFLPTAGMRYDDRIVYDKEGGYYWSSYLYTKEPCEAWSSTFHSIETGDKCLMDWLDRALGLSIRPVYGEAVNVDMTDVVVDRKTLDYEGVVYGKRVLKSVKITNNSSSSAQISVSISSSSSAFSLSILSPSVFTIGPGAYETIQIMFAPMTSEKTTADVIITANNKEVAEIKAMGYGKPGEVLGSVASAVDLGLPSGVKWASWDLGASSPNEYGAYFSWGETYTKEGFFKENYSYKDNPTTLPLSADAANVNWGGKWRIPTISDWKELFEYCEQKGTLENDVTSITLTGPNGNSIIIKQQWSNSYGWSKGMTSGEVNYRTSNISEDPGKKDEAYVAIRNYNDGKGGFLFYLHGRHCGIRIRPVMD